MEPSCAPDLPDTHQKNVTAENVGYTEKDFLIDFSYKWEIPNLCSVNSRTLKSPVFSPGVNNRLKWSLILYPFGTGWCGRNAYISGNEYLSLYLCFEPCKELEVTATFQLTYLKRAETKRTIEMNKPWTFKHGTMLATYGYDKFVSRHDIGIGKHSLIVAEITAPPTILCEIKVHAIGDSILDKNEGIPLKIPNAQLLYKTETLFAEAKYTDFTIVVDAHEFPVHRAILSAQSSVFAAMFEHDMEVKSKSQIHIIDIGDEVLQEMLLFLYTGEATNIQKIAAGLLVAADKYALEKLKNMCEEALCTSLTIEHAADTLKLADLHSADHLKPQVISFICFHAADVVTTEGFKLMVLSHPSLIAEAFCEMALRKNADTQEVSETDAAASKVNASVTNTL